MTENTEYLDLSEKLCTKMCHDLSGASMAISNSIEMLEDSGNDDDFKKMAIDIAKRGSFGLSSKIKLFRISFGMMGGNLASEELKTVLENYIATVSTDANVNIFSDIELDIIKTRILFCISIFVLSLTSKKFSFKLETHYGKAVLEIKNSKPFIFPKEIVFANNEIYFSAVNANNSPLLLCKKLAEEKGIVLNFEINDDLFKIFI